MSKQGVFVVVAILSVLPLGCSGGPSRRVVHRCRLESYELRIIREKEDLENPQLYCEVIGPDGVVKHSSYLGPESVRSYTFSSVVDDEAGIAAIVENYRPTVFVAAFELATLQAWPDRDKTLSEREAMEDRVAKQLARFTGRSGWSGGGVVASEPPTFPWEEQRDRD